jgi:hypothetical protein
VIGAARFERGEPPAETGELIGRQLGNRLSDFFDLHGAQYSKSGLAFAESSARLPRKKFTGLARGLSKLYLDDPTTNGGHLRPMSSEHHIDRKRGTKDARQQLALLREKWPVAFPAEPKSVRPLEIGAAGEIASAMGWSLPYTLGVLARWKMAPAYCRAVLAQEYRIALDGSSAVAIDAKAKDLAAKRLARLAERETANETAKPEAPVPVESKPAETSPETPEQLRARVRASLMRRRA